MNAPLTIRSAIFSLLVSIPFFVSSIAPASAQGGCFDSCRRSHASCVSGCRGCGSAQSCSACQGRCNGALTRCQTSCPSSQGPSGPRGSSRWIGSDAIRPRN